MSDNEPGGFIVGGRWQRVRAAAYLSTWLILLAVAALQVVL